MPDQMEIQAIREALAEMDRRLAGDQIAMGTFPTVNLFFVLKDLVRTVDRLAVLQAQKL
jgi:hypothetical protein